MQTINIKTNRSDTNSVKWNKRILEKYFGNANILPFGVADMDYESPEELKNALIQRANDGVFGYESTPRGFFKSITNWFERRYNWTINKSDINIAPSILSSIAVLIDLHSQENDSIIIQTPVYFQFKQLIKNTKREVLTNPLKQVNGKYEMDFEDLEEKASRPEAKILILCNPHNPVGRVWTKEELEKLSKIAIKHDVLVISDEIHSDIIFDGNTFIPYLSINEQTASNAIACLSPAKTFNIATASESLVIIKNEEYKKSYDDFMNKYHLKKTNTFNLLAMQTAYESGEEWLEQLLIYLDDNIKYLHEFIKEKLPMLKVEKNEGTFLVWLNFEELGLDAKVLEKFLFKEANIAVNSGHWFGREGANYARFNIACSKEMLKEGLESLEKAINNKFK